MNRKQRNRLASHTTVAAVMADHALDVAAIPGLPAKVEAFRAKLGEIHRLAITQIQPVQPSTIESGRLLDAMIETIIGIAGLVTTVARERGLPELARSVRLSGRSFRRPRQDRIWLAQRVLDVARTLSPDLEPFGVTAAALDEVQHQIDSAAEGLGLPRATIRTKHLATVDLEAMMRDVGGLLTDEIDRLVFLQRKARPAFYAAYRAARVVIDRAGAAGKSAAVATPVIPATIAAATPTPASTIPTEQRQAA